MRPLLVVTVTVLAVLGVSTPAIAAGRLVVSPRSGATEDGTAHLRVRAGERTTLTARLNGRDISKDSGLSGTPPNPDVLNRLFGPVSPSGDPRIGGPGMTLAAYVRMTSPQPWSSTWCTWGPL
jgi:hypothetical protein